MLESAEDYRRNSDTLLRFPYQESQRGDGRVIHPRPVPQAGQRSAIQGSVLKPSVTPCYSITQNLFWPFDALFILFVCAVCGRESCRDTDTIAPGSLHGRLVQPVPLKAGKGRFDASVTKVSGRFPTEAEGSPSYL